MKNKNAEEISEVLLPKLNKMFSEALQNENEHNFLSGLSIYRKKRRIRSEEEIVDFWRRNVLGSKITSLIAFTSPILASYLLLAGIVTQETMCWTALGGLAIYGFYQLWLIQGLERLLGGWKASSSRHARESGETYLKFVNATDVALPPKERERQQRQHSCR
ncbi:hypothetical protein [Roseibium algae]|uniref:Uncharacterized protein n=1 Tax=Roseibium algae TaxID=3123038 RepID=A0ABU8TLA0_9HYPH